MKNIAFVVWMLGWPVVATFCRPIGWSGPKGAVYVFFCLMVWLAVAVAIREKR